MVSRSSVLIIFIILLSSSVIALPSSPEAYYGVIDGAAAGITITAKIGTTTVGSYTLVKANQYGNKSAASSDDKLIVCAKGEAGCTSGASITFSPSSGSISTTSTFTPGVITNLNLAYTAPSATGTSAGAGGGGAGGGAGGATTPITITPVTDPATIDLLKSTLPEGWVNVKYEQYGDAASTTQTLSISAIDNALTLATSPEAISSLQNLRNQIQSGEISSVVATVTLTVYKIQNKDTGAELYRSKIDITLTAPNDMEAVKIIEVIPKTVASSTDDLIFPNPQPVILQKDPVIQWIIEKIAKGDTKTLTYIVKKKLSKIESITLSAGKIAPKEEIPTIPPTEEKPPVTEEREEVKPTAKKSLVTGIIIIVGVVIIGLIIYLVITRKKK